MDTSYYKKMEPFWGVWRIKRLIGEGSFGKVFEIEREDLGRVYKAALKVITIPQNESELKSVLADGLDARSATDYYRSFVMEVGNEFALMAELKGNSNIVSYEDHMIVEHKDSIGWDILIRMELLTPLLEYDSAEQPMDREQVIKLGMDICSALEYCRKLNIIHRDIKPENIFVSKNGDFKLGDFGIARTAEKTMSGLSRKGTYSYMAPEVYKGDEYGASVDIYSLGIVLYRLLNRNRTPFLPAYPAPITHSDRENAIVRRISGQQIPLPADAQDALGEIILKACAYLPGDRYASIEQMRVDLASVFLHDSQGAISGKTGNIITMQSTASLWSRNRAESQRKLRISTALACIAVLGIIVAMVFASRKRQVDLQGVSLSGVNEEYREDHNEEESYEDCLSSNDISAVNEETAGESSHLDEQDDIGLYIEDNSDTLEIASIKECVALYASATSELSEYNMTHFAGCIMDGDLNQAWAEGVSGQGIGESITLSFDKEYCVEGLLIYAGYHKSEELYDKNSRPREIEISFSNGESERIELDDVMYEQNVKLGEVHETSYVKITINSVYPGSKYDDTVISEVSLY